MKLKDMFGIILNEIKAKYGNKKDFCQKNEIDYATFTTTIDKVIKFDKDVQVGTLIKFLNAVDFDLTITKRN